MLEKRAECIISEKKRVTEEHYRLYQWVIGYTFSYTPTTLEMEARNRILM